MAEESFQSDELPPHLRQFDTPLAAKMRAWHKTHKATPRESAHQLIRFCCENDAHGDLMAALGWETDRGIVLVAAQIVDDELTKLLSDFFRSRSCITEKELDFWFKRRPQPPLQSTGLKIKLALALGLIDRPLFQSLEALQTIRSQSAAHSRGSFQLNIDHVMRVVQPLPDGVAKQARELHDAVEAEHGASRKPGQASTAKVVFLISAMLLVRRLECAADEMAGSGLVVECDRCSKIAFSHGRKTQAELEAQIEAKGWMHRGLSDWLCPGCKSSDSDVSE